MRRILLLSLLISTLVAFCPYGNSPVCGKDNITYPNQCHLNKSTTVKAHDGQCVMIQSSSDPSQMIANCKENFTPVCGIDGVTYGNDCRRKFRGIDLAYEGPCGVENFDPKVFNNKSCSCSYEWHPVCTRNSKINFENLCFVRCIHQLEGSFDSCVAPCNCETEYDPICSLNGVTYDNECMLTCSGATKHLNGECESILFDCDKGCSRSFAPVCGDDGKTHRNRCIALCNNIEIKSQGVCDSDSKDPAKRKKASSQKGAKSVQALCERCSREIRVLPVCAEDGTTYENECQCSCQNDGVCPKYANGPCPSFNEFSDKCPQCKNYPQDPVCGNDHRTYDNMCYLNCNKRALYKKGDCNSFSRPQSNSFDMRSNQSMTRNFSGNSYQSQLDQVTNDIGALTNRAKNGQSVDSNNVERLLNMLKHLKSMKRH